MEVFFIERAQVLSGRKYAEAHLIGGCLHANTYY